MTMYNFKRYYQTGRYEPLFEEDEYIGKSIIQPEES